MRAMSALRIANTNVRSKEYAARVAIRKKKTLIKSLTRQLTKDFNHSQSNKTCSTTSDIVEFVLCRIVEM